MYRLHANRSRNWPISLEIVVFMRAHFGVVLVQQQINMSKFNKEWLKRERERARKRKSSNFACACAYNAHFQCECDRNNGVESTHIGQFTIENPKHSIISNSSFLLAFVHSLNLLQQHGDTHARAPLDQYACLFSTSCACCACDLIITFDLHIPKAFCVCAASVLF